MTGCINHESRGHALLSPSSSHRWINCTPSARLAEHVQRKSDKFADEGTLAHEYAENALRKWWLEGSYDPAIDELPSLNDVRASKEMEKYVTNYVDYVITEYYEMSKTGVTSFSVEDKYDLSHVAPESFGSCDATLFNSHTIHIIDLKYGEGVRVNAQNNEQLMMYALGALKKIDTGNTEIVKMSIAQVRLDHYDTFEMSADELIDWGMNVLKPKAKLAYSGRGDLCMGDWCQFCPARPRCKKHYDSIITDFEEEQDPLIMSDDQIIDMIGKLDVYKAWLNCLGDYVYKEAVNGKKWEGYKLIAGRSCRKIDKPDEVTQMLFKDGYLEDEVLNISLKGIGELEKLVGKKLFDAKYGDYLISKEGSPKLVSESHKGEEWDPSGDFEIED